MSRFVFKQLTILLSAFVMVLILSYALTELAPGNPIDRMAASSFSNGGGDSKTELRKYWQKKLGLDLPSFYISLFSLPEYQLQYQGTNSEFHNTLTFLANEYGDGKLVSAYGELVESTYRLAITQKEETAVQIQIRLLMDLVDLSQLSEKLNEITSSTRQPEIRKQLASIKRLGFQLELDANSLRKYIPVLRFQVNNRFHRWLFGNEDSGGIIHGDFGYSYYTREPVSELLKNKLYWPFILGTLSIFLAFLLGVPMGIWLVLNKHKKRALLMNSVLFFIYSLPVFWLGSILQLFLSNPNYLDLFPPNGVAPIGGFPADSSWLYKLWATIPYIILPVVCYTYGVTVVIGRVTRNAFIQEWDQLYRKAALVRGIPFRRIITHHVLPNASFPLITLLTQLLPSVLGGAVIIETIFNIPGIGYEIIRAAFNLDYPVISAVVFITGVLTISGYFLAEILYVRLDPRLLKSRDN